MMILSMLRPGYRLLLALVVLSMLVSGCATLPVDYPRTATTAFDRPEETSLGRNMARLGAEHQGKSGFYILDGGLDAFLARAALIQAAEKSIDLQYYIIHLDLTGKMLMGLLLNAAERGVRVRLLVDDMYTCAKDFNAAAFSAHSNIDVRVFNPYAGRSSLSRIHDYITDFSRVQRRMHNKMFVVDGAVAVAGGRNLGDEYFAAREDVNFADVDVLAIGPVVKECGAEFDKYWNSELSFPIEAFVDERKAKDRLPDVSAFLLSHLEQQRESLYAKRLSESDFLHRIKEKHLPITWANAELTYDLPEKIESDGKPDDSITLWPRLTPYFRGTKSELILVSPYFVPGDAGVAILKSFRDSGVKVRVLTNSMASNDVSIVHGGYSRYRQRMLRDGIELYEVRPLPDTMKRPKTRERFGSAGASLHAKSFIFDRKTIFIGSANLDPRSRYLNTEVGMIVESPELAEKFGAKFDAVTQPEFAFKVELRKEENAAADDASAEATGSLIWIGEEEGKKVIYESEPFVGLWKKFTTWILSILAPESML